MRAWGRPRNQDGSLGPWTAVTTDPVTGSNDLVYVTTLCQVLLLNLGESPFYGNYGIPAQQSVITQVWPDFYVQFTQQQFAPFFANLLVSRRRGASAPTYNVNITTHQGVKLNASIPIPF